MMRSVVSSGCGCVEVREARNAQRRVDILLPKAAKHAAKRRHILA
jgi:hypothetical protein